jgi:hypothetical protein
MNSQYVVKDNRKLKKVPNFVQLNAKKKNFNYSINNHQIAETSQQKVDEPELKLKESNQYNLDTNG